MNNGNTHIDPEPEFLLISKAYIFLIKLIRHYALDDGICCVYISSFSTRHCSWRLGSFNALQVTFRIFYGSLSWAYLYIGSTHIDDTKNNFLSSHTLSTFLRVFFDFPCTFSLSLFPSIFRPASGKGRHFFS